MALETKTAIITGIIWRIWPVISATTTQMEMEWVTPAENAAAPTMAYPPANTRREIRFDSLYLVDSNVPGKTGDNAVPIRTPSGNHKCMASPIMRPKAAPILKIGIKLPDGTGKVEAKTVVKNYFIKQWC